MTYDVNTPAVARLWPYHPDWSGGYEVTRFFLTDVITSRNNTEQRRALRDVPRLSARYKAVVQDSDLRAANHFLRARQNDPVAVPDFSRHALTTGASLASATALTLASPPTWVAAGSLAVLCGATTELVRITNVAGSTITLAAGLDSAWPLGSVLRPALHGLLAGQMPGPRYHRGAAALQVQVSAYPGGEPVEDEGAADVTFSGYEVFPRLEPDWSGQPALSYLWPVEQVDFGIGRTAQFRPIDMAQRLTEAEFNLAKADAVTLEQFFLRMKGRRGAFWRATGEQDFALAATASSGSSTFLAEGTDLADDFGGLDFDDEPQAIEVVMTDGTRLRRFIRGITTSGDDSEVAVDEAWPSDLTVATVARISWLPLVRFAADDLTTTWRTPTQATIRATFQSVRDRVTVAPPVDAGVPPYDTVESLGEQTTTGASLAGASQTWTLAPNTDYLLFWSQDVQTDSTASEAKSDVTVGGTSIFATVPQAYPREVVSPIDWQPMGGMFRHQEGATPAATTFALTAARGSNAATLKVRNSRLTYLEMGADDEYAESLDRQTWGNPTNKTAQTAASLSFTPPSGGDYTVVASFVVDLVNQTNVTYGIELTDGATTTGEVLMRPPSAPDRVPVILILPLAGAFGAKTVDLKVRQTNTGTTDIGISEIRIVAIRNDRFDNVYSSGLLGSTSSGTQDAYTTAKAQTFTPIAADHLTLASWQMGSTSTSQSAYSQYLDDATTVNEFVREFGIALNTSGMPGIAHRIAAYGATSRTQAIQRHGESTTNNAVQRGAAIVTFDLGGLT